MKVYLLGYEHGEYSDYEAGIVGAYPTRGRAEQVLHEISDYRNARETHNRNRILALKEAGLTSAPRYDRKPDGAWVRFHNRRREFLSEWQSANAAPEPNELEAVFPVGRGFYIWDAEFTIVEVEVA